MSTRNRARLGALLALACLGTTAGGTTAGSLREQNDVLFRKLREVHGLSDAQMSRVRETFQRSDVSKQESDCAAGQNNRFHICAQPNPGPTPVTWKR